MPLVTTIRERCKTCFTCVRECPAKAIRIESGQAMVIKERCIACGNCLKVCSQNAKQVVESVDDLDALLSSGHRTVACLAPSFPAAFTDLDAGRVIAGIRQLGFTYVCEVAFGADLVADRYRKLIEKNQEKRFIATSCPALIEFVEKYHPELVPSLAPIVSPMIATARAIKELYGSDLKVVFIGPCIAKTLEADSEQIKDDVDLALTFTDIQNFWNRKGMHPDQLEPDQTDPPHGRLGILFSIARGLLQAADLKEDLLTNDIIATDGRINFVEAIKEFEAGSLDVRLLEILCCNGCIMGPGIPADTPPFVRRIAVSQFASQRVRQMDQNEWTRLMTQFENLDLSRTFEANDQRIKPPSPSQLEAILKRLGKKDEADELNCGACGYDTCREHAIAIFTGLAESEMCLPYSIDQLRKTLLELKSSNDQLADVREALVQAEKMASMGQLAAGIAHEVNNPLGVVLMYAHFLLEDMDQNTRQAEDLNMIVEQSNRCKKIVEGLLHFARQNKVILMPFEFGKMVEKTIATLRPPANIRIDFDIDPETGVAEIDHDQMAQVLINLMTNAFAAMPEGGKITIGTGGDPGTVYLNISDTGIGIPADNLAKIFEPFFTTKQIGKGTGLGLAITYGIIKMHRGDISVASNNDPSKGPTGTTFTVTLPRKAPRDDQPISITDYDQEEDTESGEEING